MTSTSVTSIAGTSLVHIGVTTIWLEWLSHHWVALPHLRNYHMIWAATSHMGCSTSLDGGVTSKICWQTIKGIQRSCLINKRLLHHSRGCCITDVVLNRLHNIQLKHPERIRLALALFKFSIENTQNKRSLQIVFVFCQKCFWPSSHFFAEILTMFFGSNILHCSQITREWKKYFRDQKCVVASLFSQQQKSIGGKKNASPAMS